MTIGRKKRGIRYTAGDKVFLGIAWILLVLVLLIIAYPLLYVATASFSAGTTVMSLSIIPKRISWAGYEAVFNYRDIWVGYGNSVLYTVVGTVISLALTVACAYPLSRGDFVGRGPIMALCVFTMYFSGGLVPTYLLVMELKMINTIWAIILPGSISIYNMIVMHTYFKNQIPGELLEASQLDGCGNMQFLLKVALPLSTPILAVIALFYAVGYWNSYFNAMIYLQSRSKYPLQIFLREILIVNTADPSSYMATDPDLLVSLEERRNVMKYAVIIVSSLPVMMIYPFIQKYFVKGIMIGAIKG